MRGYTFREEDEEYHRHLVYEYMGDAYSEWIGKRMARGVVPLANSGV